MKNGSKEDVVSTIKKGVDKLVSESEHLIFVTNNIFGDGVEYERKLGNI
jgi:hypothetical protein